MRVEGASLKLVETDRGSFPFDRARKFQQEFFDWMDDDNQFCVMQAPTGAGKTAAFTELCREKKKTLLVYPTNALVDQQKERLEEEGLDVEVLNSDSLQGECGERLESLLSFTKNYRSDVIATNPDILQAIIQNQYTDVPGKAMEFFDRIEAVVYDEFHFYSDFESSGLLMQSQIISERNSDAEIVFCSATPNEEYVKAISSILGKESKIIEAEYTDSGQRFREDVEVERHGESITSKREEAKEIINEGLKKFKEVEEHKIAVIFNSAYRSNEFYNYLCEEGLEDKVEKDNGFDTQSDVEIDRSLPVLITTSKSEVGLDFDIELMLMEKPDNASSFIQRFGRAGRKSSADTHIFNMGKVTWWQEEISFPKFENRIYEKLDLKSSSVERIEEFMGMRAAKASRDREKDVEKRSISTVYSEMYEDFGKAPNYGKWKSFLKNLELDDSGGPFSGKSYSKKTTKIVDFVEDCTEVLSSLRGRSVNEKIRYPRGDKQSATTYSLLSVLQNYRIQNVDEEAIEVRPKNENDNTSIRVKMRGFEKEYRRYEGSRSQIEDKLQKWIKKRIERASISKETRLNENQVKYFLDTIQITRSAIPAEISYGEYIFSLKKDQNGIIELEEKN